MQWKERKEKPSPLAPARCDEFPASLYTLHFTTSVRMKSCLIHPTVAYLREELIAGRTTSRALVEQARCGPRTLFALALAHGPCLAAGARSNC